MVFQKNCSSTWRELAAVIVALEAFGTNLTGQRVRWHTDNQNVVRLIVKVGSMVRELQEIALRIFFFTSMRHIQLDLNWLPRGQNSEADFFSKVINFDDYSVHDIFSPTLVGSGVHIRWIDLLVAIMQNYPGSIRDSFNQALRLLMPFHKIGLLKITG